MSAVLAGSDSDDLQALFDSIVAANGATAVARGADTIRPGSIDAATSDTSALLAKVGHLTRTLHESLRELGFDRMVEEAASAIPDARERLAYVATLTERAAERVLNATDIAKPIQDRLGTNAAALADRWRNVFAARAGVEEFKVLAESTLAFLDDIPQQTKTTGEQLMEIVLAQDFQDLTGQVIKRINELVHNFERQLLTLLLENTPPAQRPPEANSLLNGPVVNPARVGEVMQTQAQVDDLLESLGF